MSKVINIALILLDDYLSDEKLDFADMGQKVIEKSFKADSSYELNFTKFNYVHDLNDLPPINGNYQLIYLTGSRKDSYLNNEFNNKLISYLSEVYSTSDIKVLGICFGHQVICRSLGFQIQPNEKGWEVGNTKIKLNKELGLDFDEFVISEMHLDVAVATKELEMKLKDENIFLIGNTEICDVQGLYKPAKLLTFQGHPEFDSCFTSKLIDEKWTSNRISADLFKDSKERACSLKEDAHGSNDLKLQKWLYTFITDK